MTDYIKILENELTGLLSKNLKKLKLELVAQIVNSTIKKYFENLA